MKLYMAAALAAVTALTFSGCRHGMKTKQAGYSGEDISRNIEILRDKTTKSASISIGEDMEWALYAGKSVEDIDLKEAIESGRADGQFPVDVDPTVRSYFQVVTPEGQAILAERVLPMAGGYNFRDMGGYRMADGRYVKWGKLIRSDELSTLTDEDLVYLASVPVVSVVDFRSEEEISKAPDRLPETVMHQYAYSVAPGNISASIFAKMPSEQESVELMEETNRLLVTDDSVVGQYRRFFELLADEQHLPLLYHCTAGKDRTGIASVLILYALGADDQTVMDDYMLSYEYARAKYEPVINRFPDLAPLMEVQPGYLGAALDQITGKYGSVEAFLTDVLDADIEKLRELYLY
ncbi:MAG: tyrosine-protein phosphatase [Rikenellaceae bacterium]|nr:tyrosine-protein phosphatase [Rikenellaceae bacterium]